MNSRWVTASVGNVLPSPNQKDFIYSEVAVDNDGQIYAGIRAPCARIEFGEDRRWRLVPVLRLASGTRSST